MKSHLIAIFILAVSVIPCVAEYVNVYSVGNSLTVDLRSNGGVELLSGNETRPILHDYHVKCGSSLTSILANPQTTCVPPLRWGAYSDAFKTKLNFVTLQPFQGATIRQEAQSIVSFIDQLRSNPINANTRVLIYATSPYQSEGPFLQSWNRQGLTLDSPFVSSKQTFDLIYNEVRLQHADVQIVPAAHIMAALAERIQNTPNSVPGLGAPSDFYRDDIHASNLGRFVEGLSLYSSVYEKSTEGLPTNWTYDLPNFGPSINDPKGILEVQKTAWIVSQAYGRSPVPEPGSLCLVFAPPLVYLSSRIAGSKRKRSKC